MESSTTLDQAQASPSPAVTRTANTARDFSGIPQPIGELTGRTDFPECTRGSYIDIRGFAGVVVDIVNQSMKVRSPEGITQSFNSNRLKTLFAPPDRSEPVPTTRFIDSPKRVATPEPEAADETKAAVAVAPRNHIANPDFTGPAQPISGFAGQPDFPQCAYGKHVDIVGFTGVVVEIVKGSLRIQTDDGIVRSYNGAVLRKLHGRV